MIKKINIIGSGNVATHLAKQLSTTVEICTIFSRNSENAKRLAANINSIGVDRLQDLTKEVDLNIVALTDDAIHDVAAELPKHIPIVHTSGSITMDVFSTFNDFGILYPLQTFSKSSDLEISNIPFLLEANSDEFTAELVTFCETNLSKKYQLTNSELRSEIHLAAVISNNFITALLVESEKILKNNNLSLDLIKPLLEETISKSFKIGPKLSQTGPAKRNDNKVLEAQLEKITNPKLKQVYRLLSELIQEEQS